MAGSKRRKGFDFSIFKAALTRAFDGDGSSASELVNRLNRLSQSDGASDGGPSFGEVSTTAPGQNPVLARFPTDRLLLIPSGGLTITTSPDGRSVTLAAPSAGLTSAITSVTSGANTITASGSTGITFVAGTNMTITVDSGTNTVTFDASGGGSVSWGAITGTLSAQTDLQSALDAKVGRTALIRTVAGTTDAMDQSADEVVTYTSGSAITVSLPNNAVVGKNALLIQADDGQITLDPDSGATLLSLDDADTTVGKGAQVSLVVIANSGGASAVWAAGGALE